MDGPSTGGVSHVACRKPVTFLFIPTVWLRAFGCNLLGVTRFTRRDGPNATGNQRKNMVQSVEASLKRLNENNVTRVRSEREKASVPDLVSRFLNRYRGADQRYYGRTSQAVIS